MDDLIITYNRRTHFQELLRELENNITGIDGVDIYYLERSFFDTLSANVRVYIENHCFTYYDRDEDEELFCYFFYRFDVDIHVGHLKVLQNLKTVGFEPLPRCFDSRCILSARRWASRILRCTYFYQDESDYVIEKNPGPCYKCGKEGHIAKACPNLPVCFNCGNTGHISTQCKQKLDRSKIASSRKKLRNKSKLITDSLIGTINDIKGENDALREINNEKRSVQEKPKEIEIGQKSDNYHLFNFSYGNIIVFTNLGLFFLFLALLFSLISVDVLLGSVVGVIIGRWFWDRRHYNREHFDYRVLKVTLVTGALFFLVFITFSIMISGRGSPNTLTLITKNISLLLSIIKFAFRYYLGTFRNIQSFNNIRLGIAFTSDYSIPTIVLSWIFGFYLTFSAYALRKTRVMHKFESVVPEDFDHDGEDHRHDSHGHAKIKHWDPCVLTIRHVSRNRAGVKQKFCYDRYNHSEDTFKVSMEVFVQLTSCEKINITESYENNYQRMKRALQNLTSVNYDRWSVVDDHNDILGNTLILASHYLVYRREKLGHLIVQGGF